MRGGDLSKAVEHVASDPGRHFGLLAIARFEIPWSALLSLVLSEREHGERARLSCCRRAQRGGEREKSGWSDGRKGLPRWDSRRRARVYSIEVMEPLPKEQGGKAVCWSS